VIWEEDKSVQAPRGRTSKEVGLARALKTKGEFPLGARKIVIFGGKGGVGRRLRLPRAIGISSSESRTKDTRVLDRSGALAVGQF
jgi:hypothetical protein